MRGLLFLYVQLHVYIPELF